MLYATMPRYRIPFYQDTYLDTGRVGPKRFSETSSVAKRLFFNGHLMPKFTLLSALSRGQSGDLEGVDGAVARTCPKTAESGEGHMHGK
jgi:hypothetical protein